MCLTPNNHKLTDSEADLSIVFLVNSFKVFPYSISGVTFFFMISDYTVYSTVYAFVVSWSTAVM